MIIKTLRLKTRLSQSKFADVVGIPVRTIQKWEQGDRVPPDYVVKLIEYFLKNERLID
jgi:DNA-binding transcriptional regulator YiaG